MADDVQFRAWACGACGAGSAHPLGTAVIHCEVCSGVTEFRRCPKCRHGLAVSPQVRSMKRATLRCTQCAEEGSRKKFPSVGIEHVPLPAGFVDAYRDLGLAYDTCAGFTGRRSFHGALVGGTGIQAVGYGGSTGVSLYFEPTVLVACIGTMANAGCIPMVDLTSLELSSRDEFVASAQSALNPLAASVAGSLATRPRAAQETICSLTWDDGALVVLNQTMSPTAAAARFEPVLHRALRARTSASESVFDHIAGMVAMQGSGLMSQAEVDSAAAQALGHRSELG